MTPDRPSGREIARWMGLSVAIVAADQITKAWVESVFFRGEVLQVTDFFNLVLVYNRGAAFSFLAGAAGWQRLFFSAIAVVAAVWIVVLLRRHANETAFCAALSLILGGALGNLIDRIWLGAVVDFLDFHAMGWHWPAFNVADSAITCGAVLIVIDSLRAPRNS